MKQVSFSKIIGSQGIFVDGDWVESKDQDPGGDVRLIQLADIGDGIFINKSKRYLTFEKAKELKCTFLEPGDLLIARMPDPLGRACIFPGIEMPCVTVVDVCIVRPDKGIVFSEWLKLLVNSHGFRKAINKYITGTTRQRISRGNLDKLKFDVPPLEDQKRIVELLDRADTLRQKRNQAIALLDDYLKSIFLDMFGDPVKNPKRIRKVKIKEMGSVFTGNTPPRNRPENYGSFIEWIKSDNINNNNHYLTKATEFLSEIGFKEARIVPAGSVLVTCIAGSLSCIGNVGMADREVAFNQQINAIVPNSDIEQVFLYAQILFNKELFQKASTNSMKGMLNKSKFSEVELLKPYTMLQKTYSSLFSRTETLKRQMLAQSEELENQFQALMQKAFKGAL